MAADRRRHALYKLCLYTCLTLLLAVSLAEAQAASPNASGAFINGLCVHALSRPAMAAKTQPFIKQLHVQSVRNDAHWARVETESGELRIPAEWDRYIDEQVRQGLSPLLILDYGHPRYDGGDKPVSPEAIAGFVRYASFVVGHFRGRVHLYEVWNEWDAATGKTTPGTPKDYVRLLRHVYPAIKAVDPEAIVLGGAVTADALQRNARHGLRKWLGGSASASWLEQFLTQKGLDFMDGLSVHPYNYYLHGAQATPEGWLDWMQTLESQLLTAHGNREVPLYITELGWPTFAGRGGVSETLAAAYVVRTSLLARTTSFIKGIWWYQLNDEVWDTSDKENNFGLLRPDFGRKPGYTALAALNASAGPEYWVHPQPAVAGVQPVHSVQYGRDQTLGWLIWSTGTTQVRIRLRAGAVLGQKALGAVAAQTLACPAGSGSSEQCEITLSVTDVPLLIEGSAAAVQLVGAGPLAAQ